MAFGAERGAVLTKTYDASGNPLILSSEFAQFAASARLSASSIQDADFAFVYWPDSWV